MKFIHFTSMWRRAATSHLRFLPKNIFSKRPGVCRNASVISSGGKMAGPSRLVFAQSGEIRFMTTTLASITPSPTSLIYHLTFHDILDWALRNHLRFYETAPFNYDVKLHLGLSPDRLDLYIRHRSPVINFLLKFVAPVFAPARSDPALRKYFRVHTSA